VTPGERGPLVTYRHGVPAIPSRWTAYLHGHVTTADGRRTYRGADRQRLTVRLLGGEPTPELRTDRPALILVAMRAHRTPTLTSGQAAVSVPP
jgi:hypothetical protein